MRTAAERWTDLRGRGWSAAQVRSIALARGDAELAALAKSQGETVAKKKEKTEPAPPESAPPSGEAIVQIALDRIRPCPSNRRVKDDDQKTRELSESIKTEGLLQAILVRPLHAVESVQAENPEDPIPDEYEIICGERRWRAARLAGLATISAVIRDWDDRASAIARLVENLQRLDVPPLEQAEGVAALLERADGDAAEVAKRLGVSVGWVYARARLRDLAPEWREELANPDTDYDALRERVGMQEQVARLPRDTQLLLLKTAHLYRARTDDALRGMIGESLRRVADAPWKDAEPVVCGRCADCQKRSDREAVLFADLHPADDGAVCLDPECWAIKEDGWLFDRFHNPAIVGKKRVSPECLVKGSYENNIPAWAEQDEVPVFDSYDWRADDDEDAKEHPEQWERKFALFINGPRRGETDFVFVRKPAEETPDAETDEQRAERERAAKEEREKLRSQEALAARRLERFIYALEKAGTAPEKIAALSPEDGRDFSLCLALLLLSVSAGVEFVDAELASRGAVYESEPAWPILRDALVSLTTSFCFDGEEVDALAARLGIDLDAAADAEDEE